MTATIQCSGKTFRGDRCQKRLRNGSPYCADHMSQSVAYRSGNASRVSELPPPSSSFQQSFDFGIQNMNDTTQNVDSSEHEYSEDYSPKGYEGRPDTMPREAIFRNRKSRVISYEGDNKFLILDHNDAYRTVHRDLLVFPATKKKQPRLI